MARASEGRAACHPPPPPGFRLPAGRGGRVAAAAPRSVTRGGGGAAVQGLSAGRGGARLPWPRPRRAGPGALGRGERRHPSGEATA